VNSTLFHHINVLRPFFYARPIPMLKNSGLIDKLRACLPGSSKTAKQGKVVIHTKESRIIFIIGY